MTKFYTYLILSSACVFASCDKENDPEPESRASLISSTSEFGKTWSISSIETTFGSTSPFQCVMDNFITYYPSKSYETREGKDKCAPTDPASQTGTWFLNTSETELTVSLPDSTQTWAIEGVNRTTLQLSSSFPEGNRTYVLVSQD